MQRFEKLIFRQHALRRMFERGISEDQVRHAVSTGEAIETYPKDTPFPSALILAFADQMPLHIVAAFDLGAKETIIITVYRPDPQQWDINFRLRRTT
jgi:hypothetical protein